MKKTGMVLGWIVGLAVVGAPATTWAGEATATSTPAPLVSAIHVGDVAPDFELSDQDDELVRLSDYRGKKNVVLAFFVAAFTGG